MKKDLTVGGSRIITVEKSNKDRLSTVQESGRYFRLTSFGVSNGGSGDVR